MTLPSALASELGGTIAFMREDGPDHWQLWRACADLTDATQLTPTAAHQSGWPDFSPNGTRIAFNSNRADPDLTDAIDVWDIYTMGARGDDVVKLTDSVHASVDPAYSHDGRLIAFGWDAPGKSGIWVMNVDGAGARRVTTLPDGGPSDFGPRFFPDDQRLVFTRALSDVESALFVVTIDGGNPVRISDPGIVAAEADWSPNGMQIAVHAVSAGFPFESIWVMNSDGSAPTNLNKPSIEPGTQYGYSDPVWSPSGSLLMLEWGSYVNGKATSLGLATMRPDGTGITYVADGTGAEDKADWSGSAC